MRQPRDNILTEYRAVRGAQANAHLIVPCAALRQPLDSLQQNLHALGCNRLRNARELGIKHRRCPGPGGMRCRRYPRRRQCAKPGRARPETGGERRAGGIAAHSADGRFQRRYRASYHGFRFVGGRDGRFEVGIVVQRGTAVELICQFLDELLDMLDVQLRRFRRQSRCLALLHVGAFAERSRVELGLFRKIRSARRPERERIGLRVILILTKLCTGRHGQRLGPEPSMRTWRRRFRDGGQGRRGGIQRATRQRSLEPLRCWAGLPMRIAVERCIVVLVLGVSERSAHHQVQQQEGAVDRKGRHHGGGELESDAGDQPRAGGERQQRHGEDDERVAEARVQGLGFGQLSCHATPTENFVSNR